MRNHSFFVLNVVTQFTIRLALFSILFSYWYHIYILIQHKYWNNCCNFVKKSWPGSFSIQLSSLWRGLTGAHSKGLWTYLSLTILHKFGKWWLWEKSTPIVGSLTTNPDLGAYRRRFGIRTQCKVVLLAVCRQDISSNNSLGGGGGGGGGLVKNLGFRSGWVK